MEKLLTILLAAILFTSPCFAKTACEWESDNAVSYTANQDKGGTSIQVYFVNYAKSNGENEYWIRLLSGRPNNKILHWASLYIDGEEFKLKAIENPSEKYSLAGSSFYNFLYVNPSTDIPRYFTLSKEIIDKILTAKEIYIIYNMQTSINRKIGYSDEKLREVKDMMICTFSEHDKYWKPTDKSR